MKSLRILLSTLSIAFAILLWVTRDKTMISLSAFALSDNAVYYRLMHLCASWFFFVNAFTHNNRISEYILGIGMGLILAFDMYHFPIIHNVITVCVLVLACITLMAYQVRKFDRIHAVLITFIAWSVFAVGYFTNVSLLLAEIVAMFAIMLGKLREQVSKNLINESK